MYTSMPPGSPPYGRNTCREVCSILAGFGRLHELFMHLKVAAINPLEKLLGPLCQIKAAETFDVTLPKYYEALAVNLSEMPFQLYYL